MNNQDLIFKMSAAAKAANQPVQAKVFEVARAKKTAINTYLQSIGILPNTNPHKAAIQAGKAIYTELGPNASQALETMLTYSAGRVPKQLQSKRFYPLLSQAPGAFWAACLAFEESPLNHKENTALMQVSNFDINSGNPNTGGQTSGGDFQQTGDQIQGYLDTLNQTAETASKLGEAWNNFKEWTGWGNKRYTDKRPIYYFWKNGKGQPNEGKMPLVEQASQGWVKEKYEKDLQGDLGLLSFDDASKYWPFYADLLPEYDKNGMGLKGLFARMYSDIQREKQKSPNSERGRSYIRQGAYYPKDKLILPDPLTLEKVVTTPTTGGAQTGTGTTPKTGGTQTGTGTPKTGGGLGIKAEQPQDAQTAGMNNILFAVVGLFVLFLLFKKS